MVDLGSVLACYLFLIMYYTALMVVNFSTFYLSLASVFYINCLMVSSFC